MSKETGLLDADVAVNITLAAIGERHKAFISSAIAAIEAKIKEQARNGGFVLNDAFRGILGCVHENRLAVIEHFKSKGFVVTNDQIAWPERAKALPVLSQRVCDT